MPQASNTNSGIEQIFQQEYGRVLANLISHLRDFELAEDVLQEAFVTALQKWPTSGIPRSPAAWLTTVGRNKAIDRLRRRDKWQDGREPEKILDTYSTSFEMSEEIPDERIKLIFT